MTLVLSEENSKGFAAARRRLGEEALSRPLSALVPPPATVAELRDAAWAVAGRPLPLGDAEVIDRVYAAIGDRSIDDLGVATPPQISALASGVLGRFLASPEGEAFSRAENSGGKDGAA